MKDQAFVLPELPPENSATAQEKDDLVRRAARAWLRFSGPSKEHFSSSLADQERQRRSHILSALFLLVIVAVGIIAPTAIPVPIYWIPIFSLILLSSLAFLLNRAARISLSASVFILAIDATLAILMMVLPHGIRNSNIPDFDLFLLATLIGGIVLPRRLLPFLAGFHILLIFLLFTSLPHDRLLTQEIQVNQQGFAYGELSDAILLQVVGAGIAWLNAWSVDRALVRASKAEDLARAHRRLNEYIRSQVKQRERLEHGITVLKDAHARFANGDYKARANLQDNELASLALSFNLLAERLTRIGQMVQEYARLDQAFQRLFAVRDALMHRGVLEPFASTGTLVDQIYPWLKQFYQMRLLSTRCGESAEKARLALTRQRTLVHQLLAALDQTHAEAQFLIKDEQLLAVAFAGVDKARQLCQQVEEQGKQCLQETRQLEQMLKVPL